MTTFNRRSVVKGLGATAFAAGIAPGIVDAAGTRDAAIDAAKKEGAILWYDGYGREDGEAVLREFQKSYPFVKEADYVELPAAQKQARMIQECLAGGPTADVYLNGAANLQELTDHKFMVGVDWKDFGVAPNLIPNPYMMWVATAINCGLYNTARVSEADAPKTWEDLLNPKWKGRVGSWQRAVAFLYLAPEFGEDKARDYARRFAALEPRLFPGTYQVSQAIGAGELDVGIGAYDSAMRVIQKGAPLKLVMFDPVPLSMLYAGVVKYGKNPNTGKLFLAWLATTDGALAFEKATRRGHLPVAETNTAKVLQGHKHSYYSAQYEIEKADRITALEQELSRILQRR